MWLFRTLRWLVLGSAPGLIPVTPPRACGARVLGHGRWRAWDPEGPPLEARRNYPIPGVNNAN